MSLVLHQCQPHRPFTGQLPFVFKQQIHEALQFKAVRVGWIEPPRAVVFLGKMSSSRFADVYEVLLGGRPPSVPAAGAIAPLDAGVVLGLVPVELPLNQPVRPQALVGGCDGAGHHVARGDLGANSSVSTSQPPFGWCLCSKIQINGVQHTRYCSALHSSCSLLLKGVYSQKYK